MLLSQSQERLLKIVHIFTAAAWIGGACCLITLASIGSQAESAGELIGINLSSDWIDHVVIIYMGALGCIITGLIYSLFTRWGFWRHRWVLGKWLITALLLLSGTFLLGSDEAQLLGMSQEFGLSALQNPLYTAAITNRIIFTVIQFIGFIILIYLSVCKPWRVKANAQKTSPPSGV